MLQIVVFGGNKSTVVELPNTNLLAISQFLTRYIEAFHAIVSTRYSD